jgi:hypothetical protein
MYFLLFIKQCCRWLRTWLEWFMNAELERTWKMKLCPTLSGFVWCDWDEPRTPSVATNGLQAEIWTRDLHDRKINTNHWKEMFDLLPRSMTSRKDKVWNMMTANQICQRIFKRHSVQCVEHIWVCLFICFLAQQPSVGQGLLIHEVFRSHTTTHHSR